MRFPIGMMIPVLAAFFGGTMVLHGQESLREAFDAIRVDPRDLPVTFDLRDAGILSPVRVQPTGGCWSSSVMATVEPWQRRGGLQLGALSDRHLQLTHGFEESRNVYGNHFMATAYLSRGAGPVEQGDGTDSVPLLRPGIPYILSDARFIPGDPMLVKQTIRDFGPVYTMLYFRRGALDTVTHVLPSPENSRGTINHAVALVGWSDTLATPEGQGAWIVQNSLGDGFGDRGFFYVPYGNGDILHHNAVWTGWEPYGDRHRILYYDTLGSFDSYGFNDTVCYGLTRFKAPGDCRLVRLSTHINNPSTRVEFRVYSSFDTASGTLGGQLGSAALLYCQFPGYYTCDLEESVHLGGQSFFYVEARYSTPYSLQPLPVEHAIEDYSAPHLAQEVNWVNPDREKWPDAWYPCGLGSPYPSLEFDLCIRAVIEMEKK